MLGEVTWSRASGKSQLNPLEEKCRLRLRERKLRELKGETGGIPVGRLQVVERGTPGVRDFGAFKKQKATTHNGCTKIIKSFSLGSSKIPFLFFSLPPHASLSAEQTLYRTQNKLNGEENKRALRNQKQAPFYLVLNCLIDLYKHFPST